MVEVVVCCYCICLKLNCGTKSGGYNLLRHTLFYFGGAIVGEGPEVDEGDLVNFIIKVTGHWLESK